ncbi:MAG: hypothetical protein LW698_08160 [Planctomycetaceae bacterium]|nr:hypothetical protein [Planctomycetaceae bacterium]
MIAGEAIVWVVVERGENDGGAGVKPLDSWIDEYVRDLVAMDEAKKEEAPEAATQAAWSRTVFPYALPSRFQFTLNQDIPSLLEMPSSEA